MARYGTCHIDSLKSRAMSALYFVNGLGLKLLMAKLRMWTQDCGKWIFEWLQNFYLRGDRLHHMVHFTSGPNRWDPVCYNRLSIPHLSLWETPETSERFFSSGNERTVMDFNPGGINMTYGTGYHLTPEDKFHYIVDLMNMNMEDKEVYLTMTYDIIPGQLPPGWDEVKTVWLDANNCMISDVQPPSENGTFQIGSAPWKPNFEGRIINMVGHLHDGECLVAKCQI
jgi:hypothetical protein